MTTAERILSNLNEYEASHTAGEGDIWGDIINKYPLDHEATEAEDPSGRSTVAIFKDGSSVRYIEDQRRWVAER